MEEDGYHDIWKCAKSKQYWKQTSFWEKIKTIQQRDPCLFINEVRRSLNKRDFDLFDIISWNIWFIRNKAIRGNTEPDPREFIRWCCDFLENSIREPSVSVSDKISSPIPKWSPPPVGLLKINVDACEDRAGGGWKMAAVARCWNGEVVRWGVRRSSHPLSPLAAELLAIKKGILLGRSLDLGSFCVESDCASALALINLSAPGCSDLDGVIGDIKSGVASSCCIRISFVRREANSVTT